MTTPSLADELDVEISLIDARTVELGVQRTYVVSQLAFGASTLGERLPGLQRRLAGIDLELSYLAAAKAKRIDWRNGSPVIIGGPR